jgi:hypothetical protein
MPRKSRIDVAAALHEVWEFSESVNRGGKIVEI